MRAVVLGLAAFLATALLIHALLPPSLDLHAAYRDEKLAIISQYGPASNIGIFGTSRLHEGFDPAEAMLPNARMLNLAIVGGSQTEQRVLARRYIEAAHGECRLVLLELNAGLNLPPEQRFDPRAVNLYNLDTLRFVLRADEAGEPLTRRLGRAGFALLAASAHYLNAGMLSSRVFTPRDPIASANGKIIMPTLPEDEAHIAAWFAHPHPIPAATVGTIPKAAEQLIDDLAAPNVRFVYLVSPTLEDKPIAYPSHLPHHPDVPILNVARPDLYPDLYQRPNWRNLGHLSREGSTYFSRLVAEALRPYWNGGC